MAVVTVQRVWPDGESLVIRIQVEASYPDSIAEAKQQALNAYAGALEITTADYDQDADE